MALITLLAAPPPPASRTESIKDTFWGESVSDPYRWLEKGDDPEVKAWSASQNTWARGQLDQLPAAKGLKAELTQIMKAQGVSWGSVSVVGGRVFAMKRQPPKQQPFLVAMPDLNSPDKAQVIVDPETLSAEGRVAIDWYQPSPDGQTVAISLSKGGTESGDVHLYARQKDGSWKATGESIARVHGGTAGGSLAWAPDGKGFYYTRYPRDGERAAEDMAFYQQAWFHEVGTPEAKDRYELGKGFVRIAEIQLRTDQRTGRILATVQKGDGGEFAHYLRNQKGEWIQFSQFGDKILQAAFGPDDHLYVLTRVGAPRGELRKVPLSAPSGAVTAVEVMKAPVIIKESEDTIVEDFWDQASIRATGGRLYVQYQLGGPSEIRAFDLNGKALATPKQLPVGAVYGLTTAGGDDVLFLNTSFLEPPAWYRFDAQAGQTQKTALESEVPVRFENVEVVREFATSKDGTKVPVNILKPKGIKLDGSHPTIIYGYGGYGVNLTPSFRSNRKVLLDRGVIYAVANLRGGGEYGETWHREGNLTKKQNVFDDFQAVIKHMQTRGYTKPEKTAILGGSNGGLLMGATMVQRPELMKVVVSFVGIYDMLRVELSPNGAFNIPEFGTVKDEAQYRALRAYSPYHNVADKTAYPPVLFLTGENDPRVDPMQSRKMTARLQAATAGVDKAGGVLLRTSAGTGHGGDTALDEQIAQYVDVFSFIFHHLDVK